MSKEQVKALNKQERFVCEMLWGGVPNDVKWVRNSGLFQSTFKEFENGKWSDILKAKADKNYLLEWFSTYFNRHSRQVTFLLELLDWNYKKLYDLEVQIKRKHVFYCPADLEEVDKVMKLWKKT